MGMGVVMVMVVEMGGDGDADGDGDGSFFKASQNATTVQQASWPKLPSGQQTCIYQPLTWPRLLYKCQSRIPQHSFAQTED